MEEEEEPGSGWFVGEEGVADSPGKTGRRAGKKKAKKKPAKKRGGPKVKKETTSGKKPAKKKAGRKRPRK